jgi:heat shock protein HspQ
MVDMRTAKFGIGQIARHRYFDFRGTIFDVDPKFSNTKDWCNCILEGVRPHKDFPFSCLLAESDETEYAANVSEQNLLVDDAASPARHPDMKNSFKPYDREAGTCESLGCRSH